MVGLLVGAGLLVSGGFLLITGIERGQSNRVPVTCVVQQNGYRFCSTFGGAVAIWGIVVAITGLIIIGSVIYWAVWDK